MMPVYAFDVIRYATHADTENYQILLEHDEVFSKETFIKQKNSAIEKLIANHPDRLLHIIGTKEIPISSRQIAEEMCDMFGYRSLKAEVMILMEEEEVWVNDQIEYVDKVFNNEKLVLENAEISNL